MIFANVYVSVLCTMQLFKYVYLHAQITVVAGSIYAPDKSVLFRSWEKPQKPNRSSMLVKNGVDVWYLQSESVMMSISKTFSPTDIDPRSQNLRHLYPGMGLQLGNWGYSGFPCNQNIHDSSYEAYVLRSEHEDKHVWNAAWLAKIMDACVCFHVCGCQKSKYPNFCSMDEDSITQGGIGVLGFLFYTSKLLFHQSPTRHSDYTVTTTVTM